MQQPAILVLADGSIFHGNAVGAVGSVCGEVVFNTAMTGYQEILTDPSYAGQLITFTYPHIGNTGVNSEDVESNKIWANGLILRDYPLQYSNWRAEQSLNDYLKTQQTIGITNIDTRRLTRLLRDKGAQQGCIMSVDIDINKAIEMAKTAPALTGMDLAKVVSTQKPYQWREKTWVLGAGQREVDNTALPYHVVVYDFGVKRNILRLLVERGCRLTVVPAQTSAEKVLALNPNAVFLSNGPGDPAACDYAVQAIQVLLEKNIPLFGICLGCQLLALACGAKTIKMKFGHHGANHPVQDLTNKQVLITSQNHGFAIDENSLPAQVKATHRSLFDGSLQGIRLTNKPAFAFQGHPEASPGPHDIQYLFDQFINMCQAHRKEQQVAHND